MPLFCKQTAGRAAAIAVVVAAALIVAVQVAGAVAQIGLKATGGTKALQTVLEAAPAVVALRVRCYLIGLHLLGASLAAEAAAIVVIARRDVALALAVYILVGAPLAALCA